MPIKLSTRQQKIVASGVATLSALVMITAAILFIVYSAGFFKKFSHVFLPLAVAAVLAMVLDPWYAWLRKRMPLALALGGVFLSLIIPFGLMAWLFGALLFAQLAALFEQLPVWWSGLVAWLQHNQPGMENIYQQSRISEVLPNDIIATVAGYLASRFVATGSGMVSGVVSLLGWIIVPVYLAFFLILPKLRPQSLSFKNLPFLRKQTALDVIYLITEFFRLMVAFFRGQIIIALLQGVLFAIGFTAAGLEYGAALGLMLGFLNIIPWLGSMLGLLICLPLAWFQADGGLVLCGLVLAVFVLVQVIEGYYLTPKIMGEATGLNPLLIIVGIFFWGAALDGILGMILAIPLTAFVVVLWRLAREKYIGQLF